MTEHNSIRESVIIPLLQSCTSGALVGISAGAGAALLHAGDPWSAGALAGGATCLICWMRYRGEWAARLAPAPQQLQPAKVYASETPSLKLAVSWNDGRAGLFADLDVTDDQFIAWGTQVGSGRSLAECHWTGAHGVFSKGQYHAFLSRMIFHGMVRPRGKAHNQGYMLTRKGGAVCNELIRRYNSPSPAGVQLYTRGNN